MFKYLRKKHPKTQRNVWCDIVYCISCAPENSQFPSCYVKSGDQKQSVTKVMSLYSNLGEGSFWGKNNKYLHGSVHADK